MTKIPSLDYEQVVRALQFLAANLSLPTPGIIIHESHSENTRGGRAYARKLLGSWQIDIEPNYGSCPMQ